MLGGWPVLLGCFSPDSRILFVASPEGIPKTEHYFGVLDLIGGRQVTRKQIGELSGIQGKMDPSPKDMVSEVL